MDRIARGKMNSQTDIQERDKKNSEKVPVTTDLIKFILYVITLAIVVMMFYGAFDKRVTVMESEMRYKVDKEELFKKLDDLKTSIMLEIKEIKEYKKK